MQIFEQIRSLRIEHAMTQRDVARQLGVSEVSIGNWENGIKTPSVKAVVSLAKLFGVTTDDLLGVTVEPRRDLLLDKDEKSLLSDYRMLDRYGKRTVNLVCALERDRLEACVASQAIVKGCGKPQKSIANMLEKSPSRYIPRYVLPTAAGAAEPLDNSDFELIPVDNTVPREADFAVWISGNSMYPYIHDGDTVYVKRDCDIEVGDVGIFSVDGAMYCKQYYLDNAGNLILVSVNPQLKNTNVYVDADSNLSVKCYGKVLMRFKLELPNYLS